MSTPQTLRFDVTTRVQNGKTVYEAVARIPGFRPATVQKIEDTGTQFRTRSAITAVCNNRAASLGMTPVIRYAAVPAVKTAVSASSQRPTVKNRKARAAATRS